MNFSHQPGSWPHKYIRDRQLQIFEGYFVISLNLGFYPSQPEARLVVEPKPDRLQFYFSPETKVLIVSSSFSVGKLKTLFAVPCELLEKFPPVSPPYIRRARSPRKPVKSPFANFALPSRSPSSVLAFVTVHFLPLSFSRARKISF